MSWIIAGIVVLLLLYRRLAGTTSTNTSDIWKEWFKKFKWEYVGWIFFAYVIWDLFGKFVSPHVPVERKEWVPSFSWNTFEILVLIVGVVVLWNKMKKKQPCSGTAQGGSGIVVTGIPDTHDPPPMYGGVRQIKWFSSTGESVWNAIAIPVVVLAVLAGVVYASNKMPGLVNFWKLAMVPATLPAWLTVLLVANAIMAFLHKSNCFPVMVLGIFCAVVGYNAFKDVVATVPAIAIVLPAIMLSCYSLWKSDFVDWRVTGAFLVLLFFAFSL